MRVALKIFSVGNATLDIMGLSYVVEEMGMTFPIPFTLEMDNDAARTLCLGSAHKTKLKHIDCRQECVRCLRDRKTMTPVHVDSKDNDADLFTKILSRAPSEKAMINTGICTARPHGLIGRRAAWHGAMGRAAEA